MNFFDQHDRSLVELIRRSVRRFMMKLSSDDSKDLNECYPHDLQTVSNFSNLVDVLAQYPIFDFVISVISYHSDTSANPFSTLKIVKLKLAS